MVPPRSHVRPILPQTLVLGIFLDSVYKPQLPWVYSSEGAIIVACTALVGALAYMHM